MSQEEIASEIEDLKDCIVNLGTDISALTIVIQALARSLSVDQRRMAHVAATDAFAAITRGAPEEYHAHWSGLADRIFSG